MAHRCDFQVLFFDQVFDRLHLRGVDHRRTGALISGKECEISDYGNFCSRFKRKDRAFVLEKYRALSRCLSCQRVVAFDIELLAVAFGRLCGGQHCIQQFIHAGIQVFHGERTVLNRLHQLSGGSQSGCRHLEI